ncbi:MAG: BlaI family penicillinase repressor [Paraglaciecola sp.]|jgi:BlaI family penicillinase repressor
MRQLTKTEEEIMQIIWQLGRCTVSDIRNYMEEELAIKKPPHSSVSTIVRILEDKKFLDHKAYGRTHEYFSLVEKDRYSKSSLKRLVAGYFEGSVSNLVSFLVKEKDLSAQELNEMLSKLEEEE